MNSMRPMKVILMTLGRITVRPLYKSGLFDDKFFLRLKYSRQFVDGVEMHAQSCMIGSKVLSKVMFWLSRGFEVFEVFASDIVA
jgi:hypothetical protein